MGGPVLQDRTPRLNWNPRPAKSRRTLLMTQRTISAPRAVHTVPNHTGTQTSSPTTFRQRAIQARMTSPAPKKQRIRPLDQSAQVILRMAPAEREVAHAAARAAGLKTVRYVMDLIARDAQRRGIGDQGVVAGMFAPTTAEGPDPHGDRTLHAVAGRAVAAAAS